MIKYKKNIYIILSLLILFLFFMKISVYAAYSPHVFKIVSGNCSLCPVKGEKAQTGFIVQGESVQGKSGIITALHGVVGRNSIRAQDIQRKSFHDLKVIAVDIDHDLAFLSSNELQKKKDGLSLSGQQTNYTGIQCIGYPLDVPGQRTIKHLSIHPPYLEPLWTLLTEHVSSGIAERKSPNLNLKVLNIEGQLLPGCSGAPILNGKDQVVGVANGGLQIGSAISWAIPYDNISWTDASSEQAKGEIARLAHLNESALFSFNAFQASSGALLGWQEPRAGAMMDWRDANDYVVDKNREGLMGYHDWRLPSVGELQELAEFIKNSPGSYSDTNKLYWSSEDIGEIEANVVNLGNAKMKWSDTDEQVAIRSKRRKFSVRLVRSLIQ